LRALKIAPEEAYRKMDIPDLKVILADTELTDKTDCIQKFFSMAGIKTLANLDNAPRAIGLNMCGTSTLKVVSIVREMTLNPPKPKPTKPSRPKRSSKKKTTVLKEKPDEVEKTKEVKE
jgi:hypothetical protein